MAVEYKYKPYAPKKLAKVDLRTDEEKLRDNLETQQQNLEKRLSSATGGEGVDNRNLIEKALNLQQDQGFLMDVIEVINRPVEAVKGAITNIADEDPETSFLAGAWEGFSGQRGMTDALDMWEEVFDEDFSDATGFTKFVVNVASDILMDPLTYIPAGTFLSVGKKVAGGLGKVGSKVVTKKGAVWFGRSIQKSGQILNKYKAGDDLVRNAVKTGAQLDEIVKATGTVTKGAGGLAEDLASNVYQKGMDDFILKNGIEDAAKGRFKAVLEGTTREGARRNLKDLSIYFMAEGSVDDLASQTWVKINKLEVKDIFKKNAFGVTGAFGLDDMMDNIASNTIRSQNGSRIIQRIKGIKDVNGKSIEGLVNEFLTSGGTQKTLGSLFKKGRFSNEAMDAIRNATKDLFFEDLTTAGVKHLSFRIGVDEVVTLSLQNAKKYLVIKGASLGVKKTGASVLGKVKIGIKQILGVSDDALKTTVKNAGKNSKYLGQTGKVIATAEGAGKAFKGVAKHHTLLTGFTDEAAQTLVNAGKVTLADGAEVAVNQAIRLDDSTIALVTSSGKKIGKDTTVDFLSSVDLDAADDVLRSLDETDKVIEDVLGMGGKGTVTETITLAQRIRSGEVFPILQKPAILLKNTADAIGYAFNKTKGFGKDFIKQLSRIGGEAGVMLQKNTNRLAKLTKDIVEKTGDTKALQKLTKIIESGAELSETAARGYVSRRVYNAKEIFDNMLLNFADGEAYTLLPEFAKKVDTDNFIKKLNDLYSRYSDADEVGLKLFEKNGSWAIGMTDATNLKEFKRVIGAYSPEDLARTQLNFGKIELDDDLVAFWKENKQFVDDFKNLRDESVQLLTKELGFANLPEYMKGKGGYLRHTLTPDAAEMLKRLSPTSRSPYIQEGVDLLRNRKFLGNADEINRGLRAFYEGVNVDVFDLNIQSGMEDLIRVTSERLEQHKTLEALLKGSDEMGKELFGVIDNTKIAAQGLDNSMTILQGTFKDEFSRLYKNLNPDTAKMLDSYFLKKGFNSGKALTMHRSAYNILKKLNNAYIDLPQFVKGYDRFLNTWKSITLVTPGFHMRNLFGNMSNSYLAGMNTFQQARYAKRAMIDFKRYKEVSDALASGKNLDEIGEVARKGYQRVLDFMESGASQSHKGIRDLEGVKEVLEQGGKKSIPKRLVEVNFNFAEKMDDTQRYILYQWALDGSTKKLSKTVTDANELFIKSHAEAATKVTDALFDYSHLTGFEKEYMKRIFPFYTFFKNNLVFQAKNIVKNPGAYARLGRAYKYAVEDMGGIEMEDMPDYMAENMWLPIPIKISKNDKEAISFLKLNLPFSDFTQLVENPFREGVNFIAAPIKLAFELGTGVDSFTGRQIKQFEGEKNVAEDGFLAGMRNESGTLSISTDPLIQKVANDLGLRVPLNYASIALDMMDTALGNQGIVEGVGDVAARFGITGNQTVENLEITRLYQDLEDLRNLKKLYEQETGMPLPVLPRG